MRREAAIQIALLSLARVVMSGRAHTVPATALIIAFSEPGRSAARFLPAARRGGGEPEARDPGVEPRTASCKAQEERAVHCASPPSQRRHTADGVPRAQAQGRSGVDGVTWQDYEADLEPNLEDLHREIHRGAYRPQPSRRTYIPKADGRQRPLVVAALEDKIVQGACVMVLNAIYEEDFLGFSYGFRPGRGPHDALDALSVAITSRR